MDGPLILAFYSIRKLEAQCPRLGNAGGREHPQMQQRSSEASSRVPGQIQEQHEN